MSFVNLLSAFLNIFLIYYYIKSNMFPDFSYPCNLLLLGLVQDFLGSQHRSINFFLVEVVEEHPNHYREVRFLLFLIH